MDKSVDSIGSCSLDVDADITDFSDTSGSLNFPTPISVKDIVRDFTSNFQERCLYKSQISSTNEKLNCSIRGMSEPDDFSKILTSSNLSKAVKHLNEDFSSPDKKPSYLNLACSVNGYSNLTTYDSKVRLDINKSREVSPIRPSSNSIHFCKGSNSLTPPVLHTMPHVEPSKQTHSNTNGAANGGSCAEDSTRSFIQQRVERLYGPGALAQGFYSPRKYPNPLRAGAKNKNSEDSELLRKFNELSPNKDYNQFRKKALESTNTEPKENVKSCGSGERNMELPVMRHLSEEFRAQLPAISPKRNFLKSSPPEDLNIKKDKISDTERKSFSLESDQNKINVNLPETDETDRVPLLENSMSNNIGSQYLIGNTSQTKDVDHKQGEYFLQKLRAEQSRLLSLADIAEEYSKLDNDQITDDILGFLRSASGKARLLVSQKMKQFEGLCHNNLKSSPDDQFPTTNDDLQGFWDMVCLQIDHVDSIFQQVEVLKANGWKDLTPTKKKNEIKTPKTNTKTLVSSKSNGKNSSQTNSAAALKREVQRKQFLEMKRKKRLEMAAELNSPADESNATTDNLQIFVPSTQN